MLDLVYDQIQTCIETQNFERASRLKEVYQWLEQFREKQSVVLDVNVTGWIYKLVKINDRYVYVLVHLNQGRLVDLIRNKLSLDDTSLNEILALFESDYGSMHLTTAHGKRYTRIENILKWEKQEKNNSRESLIDYVDKHLPTGVIGVGSSIKKFNAFAKEVDVLLDKFLDAYVISSSREKESVMNDLLKELQQRYYLKKFPYRVECIDISHLSGGWMSGGLSCIIGGINYKRHYRKYKIKTAKKWDDYKSLEEIITRRFKLQKTKTEEQIDKEVLNDLPDLFILDGGVGQLGVVKKMKKTYLQLNTLCEHVQFASLEKWDARSRSSKSSWAKEVLHILADDGTIISKEFSYDKADKLLSWLRDEAHRFANAYRKKQMSKERK